MAWYFLSSNKQGHFSWLKGPERVWEEWLKFGMLDEVMDMGTDQRLLKGLSTWVAGPAEIGSHKFVVASIHTVV